MMNHSAFLLVAVCVAVASLAAGLTSGKCPSHCSCDPLQKLVICFDVCDSALGRLFTEIPADTSTLTVTGARSTACLQSDAPDVQSGQRTQSKSKAGAYPALETLTIHSAELDNFDWTVLQNLPDLRELHLDHDNLTVLPPEGFPSLEKLEILSWSRNGLNSITLGDVDNDYFPNLTVLDLSHNALTSLPNDVFGLMPSLVELDLSNNVLRSISPESLGGLTRLRLVNLEGNRLEVLQPEVIQNLTNLSRLALEGNPWACTCALNWLREAALSQPSVPEYLRNESIVCHSPVELHSRSLVTIPEADLECSFPEFDVPFEDHAILYLHSYSIGCNATGFPTPSIYWETPWGTLAHHDHQQWIPIHADVHSMIKYAGQPTHYEATVKAQADGSLRFDNFRGAFDGTYTCVAQNMAGSVNASMTVQVETMMTPIEHFSLIYGAATAAGFLIFSLIMASIRLCVVHVCFKKKFKHLPSGITMEITDQEEEDLARISPHLFQWSPYYFDHGDSPDMSPRKCVTPAEAADAEQNFSEMSSGILETLEDARLNLRLGMGRQVDRIRNRAHNVRQSSSRYVQNFRASSSNYMNTLKESGSKKLGTIKETSSKKVRSIRQSSSQYANRVRTGMVMGVEQVKYHVQSMKELCGTGDVSHTISTVSFSTDVDSHECSEVVRTVTYV